MAQKAIDVHTHNVTPEFIAFLDTHNAALDEGFPLPQWDVENHLKFMEEAGIETSILTMPAPQPYFGDSKECQRVIREYNESCARLKKQYPGKFEFCAALPLPDVDAAIAEAKYALDSLGAVGVKLATNSRGQYVGDATLDPLMEVLSERGAVIVLHPHKSVPVNDSIVKTTPLAIYEYPAETTRAIINMFARNVPARYPGLKFVVPHCGSFLPLAIPRMKAVHPAMLAKGLMGEIDWDKNLQSLYFDLAGAPTPDVIHALLTIATPDHLLYGSDYPYQPANLLVRNIDNLRSWMSTDPATAPYLDNIMALNAAQLFGLEGGKEVNPENTGMCVKEPMQADGIIRLSTVDVYPEYIEQYMKFASEVGAISLRTEPGVLTMYSVAEKDNPCRITILETYSSEQAYKNHIASPHFQKYKQGTLHMVKDLKLIDQTPLNPANTVINFIK